MVAFTKSKQKGNTAIRVELCQIVDVNFPKYQKGPSIAGMKIGLMNNKVTLTK